MFADAGSIAADKRVPPKPGRRGWIAARRSTVKAIEDEPLRGLMEALEHAKASIRAAVEHPLRVVKRPFGHVKSRRQLPATTG